MRYIVDTMGAQVIAGMVGLLQQVVQAMMVGSDAERDTAQTVLTNLKDHMESWKCVAHQNLGDGSTL